MNDQKTRTDISSKTWKFSQTNANIYCRDNVSVEPFSSLHFNKQQNDFLKDIGRNEPLSYLIEILGN